MTKIDRLIIHCSDSPFGDADMIRDWHVRGNGWMDIGYHAVILNGNRARGRFNPVDDGRLEPGRNLNFDYVMTNAEKGAHAYGFNGSSIGVCLIGEDVFTDNQFQTLEAFVRFWQAMIPGIQVLGHYEVSKFKPCPNFNVGKFRDYLSCPHHTVFSPK